MRIDRNERVLNNGGHFIAEDEAADHAGDQGDRHFDYGEAQIL